MLLYRAKPEKTKSDSTDATIPFLHFSALHNVCAGELSAVVLVSRRRDNNNNNKNNQCRSGGSKRDSAEQESAG